MTTLLSLRKLLALTTIAATPCAAVLIAQPAAADPESWEVMCAFSNAGPDSTTICNEGKVLPVSAPNLGQKMLLRIAAPTSHCSDITYEISRFPDFAPIAVTRRLAPGEDQILELGEGWAETDSYISITGIGHVGGCNVGEMHSWGALTEVFPLDAAPVASSSPTLLVETSLAVECGASLPFEVTPGVASMACDRLIPVDFVSPGRGHELDLTLTAPATHCSTVTYMVNDPATGTTLAMSPRLAAGESFRLSLGSNWDAGPQVIDIGAVGYVDGCNVGEMQSWGVDARLLQLN
jgi:hypothetical protein